jgi:hypothetical protein
MFTMLRSTSLAHYLQTFHLSLNIIENHGLLVSFCLYWNNLSSTLCPANCRATALSYELERVRSPETNVSTCQAYSQHCSLSLTTRYFM